MSRIGDLITAVGADIKSLKNRASGLETGQFVGISPPPSDGVVLTYHTDGGDVEYVAWEAPPGGAGASVTVKTVMVTLDEFGVGTVTDASCTVASIIMVTTGRAVPTDVNDPDMDPVIWSVKNVFTGYFHVYGESPNPIRGPFRINYVRSG
jgi:hypothetical protein